MCLRNIKGYKSWVQLYKWGILFYSLLNHYRAIFSIFFLIFFSKKSRFFFKEIRFFSNEIRFFQMKYLQWSKMDLYLLSKVQSELLSNQSWWIWKWKSCTKASWFHYHKRTREREKDWDGRKGRWSILINRFTPSISVWKGLT